jgi:hypothetical protein
MVRTSTLQTTSSLAARELLPDFLPLFVLGETIDVASGHASLQEHLLDVLGVNAIDREAQRRMGCWSRARFYDAHLDLKVMG